MPTFFQKGCALFPKRCRPFPKTALLVHPGGIVNPFDNTNSSNRLIDNKPKSVVIRACLYFAFLEERIFVCLLMSNSELLRIKNKQKTPYKKQKTASSYLNYTFNGLMTVLG